MSLPVDIYCRVSKVGGREHLQSPEEQEASARRFAAARGLTVGQVFVDLDRSGGTLEREGLTAILERIRARKTQGVVVAWLDRLTRDVEQGAFLLRSIEEAGGRVYAPEAPEDMQSPEGTLQVGMFLLVAQYQRQRARSGFERARERAVAAGIAIKGYGAVGYVRDKDRRFVPCPVTAPVIRRLFEMRAAGVNFTELVRHLESHGVKTPQGFSVWPKQSVAAILRNRVYLGEVRSAPYVNTEAHEPIIDEPTWLAAQKPLIKRRQHRPGSPYMLSGIIRCAACGYAMNGTTDGKGRRVYRCMVRHGAGVCPSPARVRCDQAEAEAERVLLGLWRKDEFASRERHQDLEPLRAALAQAERRLAQVQTEDAQDALGDGWLEAVRERRLAREAAALQLGQAEAAQAHEPVVWDQASAWEVSDPQERKQLLNRKIGAMFVTRERQFTFAPPGDYSKPKRRKAA